MNVREGRKIQHIFLISISWNKAESTKGVSLSLDEELACYLNTILISKTKSSYVLMLAIEEVVSLKHFASFPPVIFLFDTPQLHMKECVVKLSSCVPPCPSAPL